MFAFICATLLFCVRGSSAVTGTSEDCPGEFCITLSEEQLTAEAGLCVVIPCSFQTRFDFTPQNLIWYKCKPYGRCDDDNNKIFDRNNKNYQSEFEGRVSLLEPDVSQRNCSIIINDLKESDTGSYQLRVLDERYWHREGFTYRSKTTVSIGGLTQKPRIKIPTMTEGQQATLTCIAPGLCSGSVPEITWTWRGAGGTESYITGNNTSFRTKSLTAFSQRHISTLTFNTSAEHHNTNVTCKIHFTGGKTTEASSTLKVNYVKEVKLTGGTNVNEGETLNLTCSVESFPPSLIMWSKLGSDIPLDNDTGSATLVIINATTEHSGQYVCAAKHVNSTLKENINITVIYKRKPQITGNTIVKEGDVLNLTCRVESFPPALIVWSTLSSKTDLQNGTNTDLHNGTGSATLVIHNVTAEHSGQYICTAKHLDSIATSYADVTLAWLSKIQGGSGCVLQEEVLTCECISEGFPLPTIKWPLLKNHTKYSVITTVSNHTVNSTVSLTVKNHGNTTVECVSNNEKGEAKENLLIHKNLPTIEGPPSALILGYLEIILAFLMGVVVTAFICCLIKKCPRKKQKSSGILDETLEMVTSQDHLEIYDNHTLQDNPIHPQEEAEDGGVAAEKEVPEFSSDVEYASIDFSLLKRKSGKESARMQGSTKTVYAEIKKEVKEEKEGDTGEEGEMVASEEEEVSMEADSKQREPQKEGGEDEALYATVNDIMDKN